MNLNLRSAAVLVTGAATVCGVSADALAQTILKTAQTDYSSGRRYAMISAASWEAARAWARSRGGDLATINDAAEGAWIHATFSATSGKYTIGLAAVDVPGALTWSDGSTSSYRAWASGEPRLTSIDRYTVVQGATSWSVRSTNYAPFYIVEWEGGPIRVPEEYPTIDDAITAMESSGEKRLVIGPGSYTLASTKTLTCPPGLIGSISGAGNDVTQITYTGGVGGLGFVGEWVVKDAKWARSGNTQLFFAQSGFLSLEGLKIDGQNSSGFWGVIQVEPAAQVIARRCRMRNATSLFGSSGTASVQVSDSLVEDVGIITGNGVLGTFSNCTMVRIGRSGFWTFYGTTRLINSIVWDTTGWIGDAVSGTNTNCDRFILGGTGNFSTDPYWNPLTFELVEGSPCIDAGSISAMEGSGLDLTGKPRIFGGGPDVGATEFLRAQCEADFNGDGFITFEDFDEFVAAFEAGC
ncbi:MAG: choice-of-anchor Q domain-containing protein [Planctomycetota bacterium]|nr:choice-of-anchor Q domain-containing protein [Planctomycetota bacterium]